MKLFTVGPVEMYPETLKIEGTQLPYFRTAEFGNMMKEAAKLFLESVNAPEGSLFIGLTCSGTGAMDATVMNMLGKADKALVINGGSFGSRFAGMCRRYGIETDTYDIPFMEAFDKAEFERRFDSVDVENDVIGGADVNYVDDSDKRKSERRYTALLVNACETSTGQLYDLKFLGDFCRKNDMLFIVDAVSAYLADPIDMTECGIDVLLTASQKALALSPGAAFVALSKKAVKKLDDEDAGEKNGADASGTVSRCIPYYFDFKDYILNQKRGQPPFTSAVGIMIAFHDRLKRIMTGDDMSRVINTEDGAMKNGIDVDGKSEFDMFAAMNTGHDVRMSTGQAIEEKNSSIGSFIEIENGKHRERAEYFRNKLAALPVEIPDIPLSNCVTPVVFPENNAWKVFEYMKDECGIMLTPSGGEWKDKQLRVGHLGNLNFEDYDLLIDKLGEYLKMN